MRSGTSYFNFTLLRKNAARFWPIWGLYALVWVLLLPVATLAQRESWTAQLAREYPLMLLSSSSALVLIYLWAILAAMAVFSYLYSSRSAGMLHALPIRREGLFLTNYLSGLLFLVVPHLLAFLLGLLAAALNGRVVFSSLFTWLVVATLMSLFFYSFAVLCAMFTGNLLALPALYFILSLLPYLAALLLEYLAQEILFGFTSAVWLEKGAIWLSPLLHIMRSTGLNYPDGMARYYGLGLVALYALVGLVCAALALCLYRRRRLETAGDVISVGWMRPLFQWGVAACSALATGLFFYSIFYSLLPQGTWTILGWMLLWGAVGWFVAAMLLQKKFWVFKGTWKGCVVLLACLAALVGAVELDLPGYQQTVPDQNRVTSVSMGSISTYPYDQASSYSLSSQDPQVITRALALHQAVVDRREELQAWAHDEFSFDLRWVMTDGGYEVENYTTITLRLTYTLTDGSTMERRYRLPIRQSELDTAGTPAHLLQDLLNQPTLLEEAYFSKEDDRLVDAALTNLYDPATGEYTYQTLPTELLEPLMEAIQADMREGNLGRRYLLDNQERMDNCCYTDLELTFRDTSNLPGSTPMPTINNSADLEEPTYTVILTLQLSASRVKEVLKDYPNAFLSQAQALYQSQG